jgi:hypothetical protein
MATLKEISQSNPSTYKVNDRELRNGNVKTWSDEIEIVINGKSKFCKRRSAYKFGLAESA